MCENASNNVDACHQITVKATYKTPTLKSIKLIQLKDQSNRDTFPKNTSTMNKYLTFQQLTP